MSLHFEDLLPAAAESERGGLRAERAVYARLQFLARVLRHAPAASGSRALLLWLDAGGEVACAPVGAGAGVVVGRDAGCEVVLASPRLSRRHCAVRPTASAAGIGCEIEDLNSSNGTLVNGRAIPALAPHSLHDGDVIEVGGLALAVLLGRETE